MNYWPAEATNLSELHLPLFDHSSLRPSGRQARRRLHYNARGFVAHHITDVWGFTTPGDLPAQGLWPMGAAWLCNICGNITSLSRSRISRARLSGDERGGGVLSRLSGRGQKGRLVAGPSVSPENRYRLPNGEVGVLCMGPSMDTRSSAAYSATIGGARILGVDEEFRAQLKHGRPRFRRCRSAATGSSSNGPKNTKSRSPGTATFRTCSRSIPATRSRHEGRLNLRGRRARRSNDDSKTVAGTRAGAARGSSTSGRDLRTANRLTRICSR